ncbi:hypothetical protein RHL97_19170 [Clostridioides difficile]|nr:hypothetical protein [Clostridioides difficile]
MNVYYINHLNEKIDLNSDNIILQYQEFFDYSWDATMRNNKISKFTRLEATIPATVAVTADTWTEYLMIANNFQQIIEKDILERIPGKLYVGDYYLTCYIAGDKKTDAFMGVPFHAKNLSIVTDYPFWIMEHPYSFMPSDIASTNNKRYANKYAYRYANGLNNTTVENKHYAECNFRLNIYGPCTKPTVYIGGYEYMVNVVLEEGEYLEIDSAAETVTKVMTSGIRVNAFNNRSFANPVFRPIQTGMQDVAWNGKFAFDLILFEERSEPKWL